MASSVSFSISTSGGVADGYEADAVISDFCTIFGVNKDKAAAYIEKQKLVKKDLTEAQAHVYRDKFTDIGIPVVLQRHEVEMPDEFGGLSLTPANEPLAKKDSAAASIATGNVVGAATAAASSKLNGFSCPKCKKDQQRSDTCVGCGIIFEKYEAAQIARSNANADTTKTQTSSATKSSTASARARTDKKLAENNIDEQGSFFDDIQSSAASIGAAAVIAIIGALVWQFLAINRGVEYAMVAWAIGAAIGGTAAYLGAGGDTDGVVCAVLLVLAIAGGKYMTAGAYADMYSSSALFEPDEIEMILADYKDDARLFSQVGDDPTAIKRFMAEQGYSYSEDYTEIDAEEFAEFQQYSARMLTEVYQNAGNLSDSSTLYSAMYGEEAENLNMSQGEIFSELWGPFDLLFLLFGMASAFKLASGRASD